MADNVLLGRIAKVDIYWVPGLGLSPVPFRVLSGEIADDAEIEETTDTDTENGGREYQSDYYTVATIRLNIQLDFQKPYPSTWLYAPPYALIPGSYIGLTIWPEGRSGPTNSQWLFPFALVKTVLTGFAVRDSAIYGGVISLLSYGRYKRPYEQFDDPTTTQPAAPPATTYPQQSQNQPAPPS